MVRGQPRPTRVEVSRLRLRRRLIRSSPNRTTALAFAGPLSGWVTRGCGPC